MKPRPHYRVPFQRRGSIVGESDLAALAQVVRSPEPLSAGIWRERFERRFADLVGARHALSVTSGTVALELAVRLLDRSPGDEVIATPQTFQATVQPLLNHDITVRFCDIDPDTLNLDPHAMERLITHRTRAVMLVHYGGCPADMERIVSRAHRDGIVVIEDCAHALGTEYRGARPGALADIGCFSFHSTKNVTTLGEGGMITLRRDDWAERIRRMRDNEVDGVYAPRTQPDGTEPGVLPWMMYASEVYRRTAVDIRGAGTNATLSEAAAAVGLVQLDGLDRFLERRRWIAARLDAAIAPFPGARLQHTPAASRHAYHLYTFFVTFGRQAREHVVRALDRMGVEVQLRYFPLHLGPEWRSHGHGHGECPVAEHVWFEEHLNLPCHPGLTDEQVDYLVKAVTAALREVSATAPVGRSRLVAP